MTLLAWDLSVDSEIDLQVANIVKRVKTKGDAELLALTTNLIVSMPPR